MTIILSALFGGLVSAFITGYLFEYRDKRQLYLKKYEDVLKIIGSHQKRTAEYINRLDHLITTKEFAKVPENKEFYDRDVFLYIEEIAYIHLIKYYDNKFDEIADSYFNKSRELFEKLNSVFDLLDEGKIPEPYVINDYGKSLKELQQIARNFIDKIRLHIQVRMYTPWQAISKTIKNLIGSNFNRKK